MQYIKEDNIDTITVTGVIITYCKIKILVIQLTKTGHTPVYPVSLWLV